MAASTRRPGNEILTGYAIIAISMILFYGALRGGAADFTAYYFGTALSLFVFLFGVFNILSAIFKALVDATAAKPDLRG